MNMLETLYRRYCAIVYMSSNSYEEETMKIHEFGTNGKEAVILIHPSLVSWDYFEYVIPLLAKDYHVLVPVLPGYDLEDHSEFTSIEEIASELEAEILKRNITRIHAIYGCSMGGSIVLRMAADRELNVSHYIMDGGITPYQLPWLLTRVIAVRDFALMAFGKLGGEKLMARAFSSTDYSKEDLAYVAGVMKHCSYRTLWNTFDSCNNYWMPKEPMKFDGVMHYWYAQKERKARDWDIRYMKKYVPDTVFSEFSGTDHGDLAAFYPERFADEIRKL